MHYAANVELAFNSVEHKACFIFIYLMCAYLLFKVNIFKNRVLFYLFLRCVRKGRGIYTLQNVLQLISLEKELGNNKFRPASTNIILPDSNLSLSAANNLNIISDDSFFD